VTKLAPVYSVPFISYTPDTPNNSFLVPDGNVAIVRDMEAAQNVGGWILTLGFRNSDAAPYCDCVQLSADGVSNSASWHGRIVVPGGGTIAISLSELGSAVGVYVGGYLLTSVAP
jgi:hypothetical protein